MDSFVCSESHLAERATNAAPAHEFHEIAAGEPPRQSGAPVTAHVLPDLPGGAEPPGAFSEGALGPNEKICAWCKMHFFRKKQRAQSVWEAQIFCSTKCKCSANAARVASAKEAENGPREKSCVVCGAKYQKPKDEHWRDWRVRKVCSVACSNTHRRLQATATSGIPDEKICPHCGAEFHRPKKLDRANWKKRIFCSVLCRSQSIAAAASLSPPKECPGCERPFRRLQGEGVKKWSVRVFCSARCKMGHEPRPRAPHIPSLAADAFQDSPQARADRGSMWMPARPYTHVPYAVSNWRG